MKNKQNTYIKILILGLFYAISGILSLKFQKYGGITPIWPPSGVALAFVLLWGYRVWPGILAGLILEAVYMHFDLLPLLTVTPGVLAEPLIGAWMINRFRSENCFNSVGNTFRFIRSAFIAPLFASAPAVVGLLMVGNATMAETPAMWFTWWMGDMIGIMIFTPLITIWSRKPNFKPDYRILFLSLFFLIINFFVFFYVPQTLMNDRVTLSYLTVTLVIWIAVRYDFYGTTMASFIVSLFAIIASYLGAGPFKADQVLMEVFLQVSFLAVTASSGLIIAAVIRENATTRQALSENEQRLRTLINSTPDIICFKDGEGRWLDANNADLELFQLTNVDYFGKKDSELAQYSPFYYDAFMGCEDSDEIAWKKGELSKGEEIIPRPDNTSKIYEVIKVPLFEDSSRKGLVVLGRDITERKIAEEKLNRYNERLVMAVEQKTKEMEALTQKMLRQEKLITVGKVSGSIAHELRNPLGAIKQSVYFLKRKLREAPDKIKEHLSLIENELNTSETVIQNLLETTRMKPLTKKKHNLHRLINDCLASLAIPSGISVQNNIDVHLDIQADSIQIKQVFVNILENAIQACNEKGEITIEAGLDKNTINIKIGDNGIGIPQKNIALCFEPLFTTKAKGTGLGLAICKDIVERHDGTINVESIENKGTVFEIKIPVLN